MRLDHVSREIICKVVYCGPGLSGKTTNLQYIHERAPKNAVGRMVSIDTESERTLHFDLLPLDLGTVQGYKCRFEFYTVPGQTYYGATRRMVLEGADGIVFIVDSRREMLDENVDALNDLFENLHHHGLPSDMPMVVQYNKQDLPESLSADQLNPLLNPRGVAWFAASATNGDNILETMKKITTMVIDEVGKKEDLNPEKRGNSSPQAAAPEHDPGQTWILTCHNCQSLLEVPSAKKGDIFTCGSCRAPLEVKDPDKGLTRAPTTGPVRRRPPAPPEETGFAMQALGDITPNRSSALSADPSGMTQVLPNQPFTLDGYTAVARLDESLLGQRYRVRETTSGRFLRALSLNPQPLRQPGYLQGLEPALSMANQVHHKGILKLVGMRKQGEQVIVLTTDAPDHQPLSHVLARRSQLQAAQALRVIHEMALALDEAARHGVIHGWLRPDVVLLNAEGAVLIDELGLPKPHAFLLRDSMGASAATEHYLAPEHLVNDSPSDTRTDIFQMGSLLFRMLTGEGLVTGYSAHEALHKVSASGCRKVRSVNPEISREIDTFCSRLTAIERKDRFQSHREVLEGLDRLSHHRRGATLNLTNPNVRPPATRRANTGTGPITSGTGQIRRSGTGPLRRAGTGTRPLTGSYSRDAAGRPTAANPPKQGGSGGIIAIIVILVIGAIAVAIFAMRNPGQGYLPFGSDPQAHTPPPGTPPRSDPVPDQGQAPVPVRSDPPSSPSTPKATNLIADAETKVAAYQANPDPQGLAAANAALSRIKELDPRKWSGLRQTLMAAMPVGDADPTPVADPTPSVDPATPSKDPQPAQQDPPVEQPAGQLSDAQIAELETLISEQRFKTALTRVADLVGDEHQRQGWIAEVTRRHGDARAAMQRAAMKAGSEDEVRTLLEPAIRLWNMDGDRAWADALITAAGSRQGGGPAVADPATTPTVVVEEAPQQPPATSTESPNGFLLTALRADAKIDEFLAQGNLPEAERILKAVEEASTEAAAIRHKIQVWGRRSAILAEIIASRSPRIRATPPISADPWDVVGAVPEHLLVAEPSGAKMNLTWSQVKRAELGRIFGDAAADANATPMEVALAAIANIIAEQPGPAALAANRAEKLQYERARELQLLLEMYRERHLVLLLDAADAAVKSNDPVQLTKVIEELSRGDRLKNPTLAKRVAELEKTVAGLVAGGTTPQTAGGSQTAAGSGKDHLTFDNADDRLAFGERTGAWSVGQGVIANNGDGSLVRSDCGNASGLLLSFTPTKTQGGFTVDFRGVRLVMDLTAQQFLVTSQDERIAPRPFPFIANTQYVIYYTLDPTGTMNVQINQADPLAIKTIRLSSTLGLSTDTGAMVSIDEIELRRGAATPENLVTTGVDPAQQQILREALGIEPLGGAYKDPASPAIILPRMAGGQSGIAIPIREGMKGAVFTLVGQDAISVGVGTVDTASGTANGPLYETPLPLADDPPLQISVTLTALHFLVQIEQEGAQASTYEVELPAERTHIFIRAALEARVLKTPKILR